MKKKITQHEFSALLDKFLSGKMTPEEKNELFDILPSSRARELFESLSRERWEMASGRISEELRNRLWREIKREVAPRTARKRGLWSNPWIGAAASLLVAACVGLGGYAARGIVDGRKDYQPFTVSVDSGQKANITLPDGTVVWMNSMSTLSYDAFYNHRQRNVTLEGEAYFDVASDPDRRFVVHTQGLEIEALGTAFNVKSYSDDGEITTSLREGRVRVNADQRAMELAPAQKSVYRKADGMFLRSQIADMSAIDSWRNSILVFDSAPLAEIARTVERMYGVNVEFRSEALKRICFTGTISNNSITNIFYIISLTYPISYTIDGSTVMIGERRR